MKKKINCLPKWNKRAQTLSGKLGIHNKTAKLIEDTVSKVFQELNGTIGTVDDVLNKVGQVAIRTDWSINEMLFMGITIGNILHHIQHDEVNVDKQEAPQDMKEALAGAGIATPESESESKPSSRKSKEEEFERVKQIADKLEANGIYAEIHETPIGFTIAANITNLQQHAIAMRIMNEIGAVKEELSASTEGSKATQSTTSADISEDTPVEVVVEGTAAGKYSDEQVITYMLKKYMKMTVEQFKQLSPSVQELVQSSINTMVEKDVIAAVAKDPATLIRLLEAVIKFKGKK